MTDYTCGQLVINGDTRNRSVRCSPVKHSEVTWHSTAICVSGHWWHSKPVERSDFNIDSQVNILFWGQLKCKHMPRSFLAPCAKDLFPRLGVVVER